MGTYPNNKKSSFRSFGMIISLFVFSFFIACAFTTVVPKNAIDKRFDSIISNINRNHQNMYRLRKVHIGKSGYFYVIGTNGRIVYHPREVLIGMSFMKNPFVIKMIEKRTGCMEQDIKPEQRIIIFRPINDTLILCMSIDPSEVNARELGCEEFRRKAPPVKK